MNKKNKIKKYNRRRCVQIANELIDGPLAIIPPQHEENYGWMECDLRIVIIENNYSWMDSVALYTDDSMNKASDFFFPVLRVCSWQREKDMPGDNKKPSINITLNSIVNEQSISDCIFNLQKELSSMSFIAHGLIKERNGVCVERDNNLPQFRIYMRNGNQTIDYRSAPIVDDVFTKHVFRLFDFLKDQAKEFDKSGWQERYRTNLDEQLPEDMWDWKYQSVDE